MNVRGLTTLSQYSIDNYMADDIKNIIEQANESLREDIKGVGITIEAVQSDVKHVVEAVDTHTRQIKELQEDMGSLKKDTAEMKDDVAAIKTTLEAVNLVELKQELTDLKKRVEELEANQKR